MFGQNKMEIRIKDVTDDKLQNAKAPAPTRTELTSTIPPTPRKARTTTSAARDERINRYPLSGFRGYWPIRSVVRYPAIFGRITNNKLTDTKVWTFYWIAV